MNKIELGNFERILIGNLEKLKPIGLFCKEIIIISANADCETAFRGELCSPVFLRFICIFKFSYENLLLLKLPPSVAMFKRYSRLNLQVLQKTKVLSFAKRWY